MSTITQHAIAKLMAEVHAPMPRNQEHIQSPNRSDATPKTTAAAINPISKPTVNVGYLVGKVTPQAEQHIDAAVKPKVKPAQLEMMLRYQWCWNMAVNGNQTQTALNKLATATAL